MISAAKGDLVIRDSDQELGLVTGSSQFGRVYVKFQNGMHEKVERYEITVLEKNVKIIDIPPPIC